MNLAIRTKLALAFGFLLVMITGAGISGVSSLSASNDRMKDFSSGPFVQVEQLGAMRTETMNLARALNLALATPDDAGKAAKLKQFQDGTARFEAHLKQYEDDLPPEARGQAQQIRDMWLAYLPAAAAVFDMTRQNASNRAIALRMGKGADASARLQAALEAVADAARVDPRDVEQIRLVDAIRLDGAKLDSAVDLIIMSPDAASSQTREADFKDRIARITDRLARLSGGNAKALEATRAAWQAVVEAHVETVRLAALNSDEAAAEMVLGPVSTTRAKLTDLLAAFQTKEDEVARNYIEDTAAQYAATRALLLGLVGSAVLIGIALAWLIGRSITKPIMDMTKAMASVAEGDLSTTIPALNDRNEVGAMARAVQIFKDNGLKLRATEAESLRQRQVAEAERAANAATLAEVQRQQQMVVAALANGLDGLAKGSLTGRISQTFSAEYEKLRNDFNAAMAGLQDTMRVVASNASAIQSGTGEISTASDDLSRRTEQQAASLEETAAALNEITTTVRRTAQGAKHAREVVGSAKANAERSGRVVRQAVEAMGGIEKSAREISQIVGVIDEIAFQTNLLALNAGVEAARAGDAGRGFAVVASEVRALAQRSAEAAKEIKGLISASDVQVAQGVAFVGQTGTALSQMVDQVTEIDAIVGEIASSAQEQAAGLEQVNTAVTQMDQVTQQNAAMVEESTAASQALVGETAELTRLIAHFDLGAVSEAPGRATPSRATEAPRQRQPGGRSVAMRTVGRGSGAARKPEFAESDWTEF